MATAGADPCSRPGHRGSNHHRPLLYRVDPFIMGMTQAAGSVKSIRVAAMALTIAAASNNMIKGIYARSLADKSTGAWALGFLVVLVALGLLPLLWL